MENQRLYFMDVLRCFSMFVIIYYHLTGCINSWSVPSVQVPFQFSNGISFGVVAVSVFFIVSGDSLYYVNSEDKDFSIKIFYMKRIKGILPLFWITWLAFFLYDSYFHILNIDLTIPAWRLIFTFLGIDQYVSATTGIKTFGLISEWFLGCIMIIYILFPLLRKLFIQYPKQLFIILFIIYILFMLSDGCFVPLEFSIGVHLFEFSLGMYFIRYMERMKKGKIMLVFLSFAFILLTVIDYPIIFYRIMITILATLAYYISYILFYQIKNNTVKSLLSLITKYSYAIFLNHHVIMAIVFLYYYSKRGNPVSSYTEVLMLSIVSLFLIVICSVVLVKVEEALLAFRFKKGIINKELTI